MAREYVIVDLETTGLDHEQDEIIEIAAVKVSRGLIIDSFSSLVACSVPLKPEITALTGISDAMLKDQPALASLLDGFTEFVGGATLAAHNAEFDAGFLRRQWPDERQWLDTITLAQIVYPTAVSYSLANLSALLNIEHQQAHRALGDAMATAALLILLEKELNRLPPQAREEVLLLAEGDSSPLGELLRHKLKQQGCAESVLDAAQSAGIAKRRGEDKEYFIPRAEIEGFIGEGGLFGDRLDGFENRPVQLQMSLAVTEVLNEGGCLLAEAGTGTGKSLAYLLPAALLALGSGKQVAVSTHTMALQEQLLNKDIPMLEQLLKRDIHAAALKGRGNYLCRRLYRYMLSQPPENLRHFLMRVAVWRATTSSADGSEMHLTSYDKWKWRRISAARENCMPGCSYARRNTCLVQKARIAAARADIIILNHALLAANAAIDKGFLPALPQLIVDEAQHMEHAAEDQLTRTVDIYETLNLIGRLKRRERGQAAGTIAVIKRQWPEPPPILRQMLDKLETGVELTTAAAGRFFDLLAAILSAEAAKSPFFPARIRILPAHRQSEDWPLLLLAGTEFSRSLQELSAGCLSLLDQLSDRDSAEDAANAEYGPGDTPMPDNGSGELFSTASLSRELATTVEAFMAEEDENHVGWVEFADAAKKPSVHVAPVEIGELLRDSLYANLHSLVMTSATLAAGEDFNYFRHRLGLDLLSAPPRELTLPSPFFYRDQALFTIVDDLPDWSKCGETAAVGAISEALIPLLTASNGRAIVLFTSHYQLKAVYEQIRQPLREQGVTVLAHGVSGGPSSLLRRLKQEERCCILGANSFWEGIDVIGSALSLIVVVRLPFWPPNTPLTAARMERIEAEGGSSFKDFSLPQALIRFKQGFGRLIRSDSDSGVFCVLDRRILEKPYGRKFIRSLPDMRVCHGSSKEMAAEIAAWLKTGTKE